MKPTCRSVNLPLGVMTHEKKDYDFPSVAASDHGHHGNALHLDLTADRGKTVGTGAAGIEE